MTEVRGMMSLKQKLRNLSRVGQTTAVNRAAYAGGLIVEGACKVNIRNAPSPAGHQGLIDTGFMLNSVYTVGPDQDNFSRATSSATRRADQTMGPKPEAKNGEAIVSVGAEYFRWWEEGHRGIDPVPMLQPALTMNEGKVKAAVEAVVKAELRKAVGL